MVTPRNRFHVNKFAPSDMETVAWPCMLALCMPEVDWLREADLQLHWNSLRPEFDSRHVRDCIQPGPESLLSNGRRVFFSRDQSRSEREADLYLVFRPWALRASAVFLARPTGVKNYRLIGEDSSVGIVTTDNVALRVEGIGSVMTQWQRRELPAYTMRRLAKRVQWE
jgi:hypothetical protein